MKEKSGRSVALESFFAKIPDSRRDIAILFGLNEAIASIANRGTLFQLIFEMLRPVFRFDIGVIQILSEDGKFMDVFLQGVSVPDSIKKLAQRPRRVRVDEMYPPVDMVNPEILRIRIEDLPPEKRLDNEVSRVIEGELGIREMVLCPLQHSGKIFGHMVLGNGRRGRIRDEDLPLLGHVSRVVAGAVMNTVAYERLERKERDAEQLLRFATALMEHQERNGFLGALVSELRELRPFRFISIMGMDRDEEDGACAIFDGKEWRPSVEQAVQWVEPLEGVEEGGGRVRIQYLDIQALRRAYSENTEVLALLQRHTLSAAVVLYLDLDEFPAVTLFLGGDTSQAERLLEPGLFEQAAPQMLLAIRSMLDWERIEYLQSRLQQENRALYEEISAPSQERQMIGESPVFRKVLSRVRQVAAIDTTVLLLGETGTGKEVMARYLHDLSPRHAKPMVRVNCASLPAPLIESDLFGHEKGAFTGAVERRIGKFELAQGGTIFLDEIGELPIESQAKLLRVLQERELERVGGKSVIPVDVRVIAATNRDLEEEVRRGGFRADLFFRLNVFPIELPPLRDRKDDIPVLADAFLRRYARRFGRLLRPLDHEEGELLKAYRWPGNVRELEHIMERAAITAVGSDPNLREFRKAFVDLQDNEDEAVLPFDDMVRSHILAALRKVGGRVSGEGGAADLLGLNAKTLDSKMRKYGIQRQVDFR